MLNNTIKRVTQDIEERFNFNTAISAIMELVNAMYNYKESVPSDSWNRGLMADVASNLVILLAPFAPHLSEEKWEYLGKEGIVHERLWPNYDPAALSKDEVEIVVQLNGKVRDRMKISTNASDDELRNAALELPKIKNAVVPGQKVDVIVVPGRLVNIVLK